MEPIAVASGAQSAGSGSLISGISSASGGGFGAGMAFPFDLSRDLFNYGLGAYGTKKQREWSKMMSDTAYQRAVKDMRAAGLNPALLYGGAGGAASTPGTAATPPPTTTTSALAAFTGLKRIKKELDVAESTKRKLDQDTELSKESTNTERSKQKLNENLGMEALMRASKEIAETKVSNAYEALLGVNAYNASLDALHKEIGLKPYKHKSVGKYLPYIDYLQRKGLLNPFSLIGLGFGAVGKGGIDLGRKTGEILLKK